MTIENLKTMRQRIRGCFGVEDKLFARHALDEGRAKELRTFCKQHDIDPELIVEAAIGHMLRNGINNMPHLRQEMDKVREFFSE